MTEGHTERLEAALAGRYKIERKLGEGGMASVYLAEDLKHERNVALKILRPELAAVIGAERFLSEIKTTANLQHPHILPLFDSGSADGYLYYVMPFIDGETLRDKLDREKQLGVEESVRIARDVSDALDYAHRHGVIHRDIKPGNILLHDGRPVVADFGIALAVSAAGGGRMTETGLSLGTPHYMSPEQASADRDLSARSDVYSLGCVLYEMLGGQPPHTGPSAQSILVHILTEQPKPLTSLRHTVPPNVAAAVAKSIEKLPADRFESAKAFREALSDVAFTYAARPVATVGGPASSREAAPTTPDVRHDRKRIPLGVSVVMTAFFATLAAWGWLRPTSAPTPGVPTRARVTGLGATAGTVGGWKLAISPDGRWIAAVGPPLEGNQLFIRGASDTEWRTLPNTRGAGNPTFSPDGQYVAFSFGGAQILKVPITGGPPLPVALGDMPFWALNDTIYYTSGTGLYKVASSGGEPELLLQADTTPLWRPAALPGGRAVVFGTGNATTSRIALLDLETHAVRELIPAGTQPRYVSTGHLVYGQGPGGQGGALMGVPFDLETLQATGSPVTLLPDLAVAGSGASMFSVSETGTLVYTSASGPSDGSSVLVEVSLDGTETPLALSAGQFDAPRYSPDGTKIAYGDRTTNELRIYDVATGADAQFAPGGYPVWSTTGDYLYYSDPLTGPGIQDGYRRVADGRLGPEQLWSRPGGNMVADVSAGDSVVVVREDNANGAGRDILLMRSGPDGAVFEDFLTESWSEINAEISPDGRWIAYQSDETGEYRVYVQSFPVKTGQRSVSPGLGTDPIWGPDGRRIYYRSAGRVMAVDVQTEPDFRVVSAPRELFDRPEYTTWQNPGPQRTWDLSPDGTRFIVVKSVGLDGRDTEAEVYIVTNWFEELRERMGS